MMDVTSFQEPERITIVLIVIAFRIMICPIVDSVAEVLTIPDEGIVEPPKSIGALTTGIKNIGKVGNDVMLLLDCEKLLTEDERIVRVCIEL